MNVHGLNEVVSNEVPDFVHNEGDYEGYQQFLSEREGVLHRSRKMNETLVRKKAVLEWVQWVNENKGFAFNLPFKSLPEKFSRSVDVISKELRESKRVLLYLQARDSDDSMLVACSTVRRMIAMGRTLPQLVKVLHEDEFYHAIAGGFDDASKLIDNLKDYNLLIVEGFGLRANYNGHVENRVMDTILSAVVSGTLTKHVILIGGSESVDEIMLKCREDGARGRSMQVKDVLKTVPFNVHEASSVNDDISSLFGGR